MIAKLEEEAPKVSQVINENKTKYMAWAEKDYVGDFSLKCQRKIYNFKELPSLTTLGIELYTKSSIREKNPEEIISRRQVRRSTTKTKT